MHRIQTAARLIVAGSIVMGVCACSGSSSSGSSPTAPSAAATARIVSLDSVEPRGPSTLVSLPAGSADFATLSFTVECEPASPSDPCHIGFDFIDADENVVPRGPGSGDFAGSGVSTMEAAGAPKSFTGDTIGVRAYVTVGTTAKELTSVEFRRSSLSFTWVAQ